MDDPISALGKIDINNSPKIMVLYDLMFICRSPTFTEPRRWHC